MHLPPFKVVLLFEVWYLRVNRKQIRSPNNLKMKRITYLFTIAILALVLAMPVAAHASKKKPAPKPTPASLPINTNVVYLVIAGLAIGIFAVRKSKQAEAGVR